MLRHRVIPFLLVRDGGLVKTECFGRARYLGDPINAIRIFNEKEVDELALLDIGATPQGTGPNLELVRSVASECFMPLAYGGGIRDLGDAKQLFRLGVEKVVLRSAALENPNVVGDIARYAGSSSVAVAIDIKNSRFGSRRLLGARSDRGRTLSNTVESLTKAGAGEVILTSVDRDGTMRGMDTALISEVAGMSDVPLVAVGGVGSLQDIADGIKSGADAVGAGAFFVFHGPRRAVLITYPRYSDLTKLLGDTR